MLLGLNDNRYEDRRYLAARAARLEQAKRLFALQRHDTRKLYSVHAPEVVRVAKGKANKRYEFGAQASLAPISEDNWVVALAGNPCDGHSLTGALIQIERLTGVVPRAAFAIKVIGATAMRPHAGPCGRTPAQARHVRSAALTQAAIEPSIGHLKHDHRPGPQLPPGQHRRPDRRPVGRRRAHLATNCRRGFIAPGKHYAIGRQGWVGLAEILSALASRLHDSGSRVNFLG